MCPGRNACIPSRVFFAPAAYFQKKIIFIFHICIVRAWICKNMSNDCIVHLYE